MPPEPPKPPEESGLIIPPGSGLALLANGDPQVLSEIISRSLAHIQTSKALAVAERRAGEECELEIAPGVKMAMCWIPPGEFIMGSPADEEGRRDDEAQHRVRITQGFWLAKTPTTQAQWRTVMGNNPYCFNAGEDIAVVSVSWEDICGNESGTGGFLGELNKHEPTGGRFHLPSEAQWEYACRAGTSGPYAGDLDEMGWHHMTSDFRRHPVGQKKANAWGLHDMHGNVWEWCADRYGAYDENGVTDPRGAVTGSHRVIRSSVWDGSEDDARSARRFHDLPSFTSDYGIGFRVARGQP